MGRWSASGGRFWVSPSQAVTELSSPSDTKTLSGRVQLLVRDCCRVGMSFGSAILISRLAIS